MTIIDKGCWERGCPCYDHREDEGVKVISKEWINLTDEEAAEIWGDTHDIDGKLLVNPKEIVKRIEAQLREKNT